jgi:hypothetical protein
MVEGSPLPPSSPGSFLPEPRLQATWEAAAAALQRMSKRGTIDEERREKLPQNATATANSVKL